MPHRHLIDLPDLPSGLVKVNLSFDQAADTYLVTGYRDREGLVEITYEGEVFRRKYADLLEWAVVETVRRRVVFERKYGPRTVRRNSGRTLIGGR